MAYSESLARRIRQVFGRRRGLTEKKMFGGVCFLLDGNMCVGIWKTALIVRLGSEQAAAALAPNIATRARPAPPLAEPVRDLDALPPMARDLLDERWGIVHMTTQRGCPFRCTYCAANKQRALYPERPSGPRRRSPEGVVAELEALKEEGGLSYVVFLDDTFTLDRRWVHALCELYAARLRVPFSIHARVDTVDPPMLETLAGAGCSLVSYGVESGSPRVRRELLGRPGSDERHVDAFRWTREAGIVATANYMLGVPGETLEDLELTFALHERLAPDDFWFFVFYPFPGTALFELCLEKGYLPPDYRERSANHRQSILRLPGLSPDDIAACYDRWTRLREAHHAARYGVGLSLSDQGEAVDLLGHDASTG